MDHLCLHSALMRQQWEITKGHLRALAALKRSANTACHESPCPFQQVEAVIEAYIADFEGQGLPVGVECK